jgi:hypothetical protein
MWVVLFVDYADKMSGRVVGPFDTEDEAEEWQVGDAEDWEEPRWWGRPVKLEPAR